MNSAIKLKYIRPTTYQRGYTKVSYEEKYVGYFLPCLSNAKGDNWIFIGKHLKQFTARTRNILIGQIIDSVLKHLSV